MFWNRTSLSQRVKNVINVCTGTVWLLQSTVTVGWKCLFTKYMYRICTCIYFCFVKLGPDEKKLFAVQSS